MGITFEEIVARVTKAAEERGFVCAAVKRGLNPYLLDVDNPMIRLLHEASESVIGDGKKPFTLGGGTYAHWLPNAYVFGMNGNLKPADFPAGRGGAHGIDECVSLARLKRAMRIYARALLALNEMNWN
jgi:succinyl-diaminopimelate desuccinylase